MCILQEMEDEMFSRHQQVWPRFPPLAVLIGAGLFGQYLTPVWAPALTFPWRSFGLVSSPEVFGFEPFLSATLEWPAEYAAHCRRSGRISIFQDEPRVKIEVLSRMAGRRSVRVRDRLA